MHNKKVLFTSSIVLLSALSGCATQTQPPQQNVLTLPEESAPIIDPTIETSKAITEEVPKQISAPVSIWPRLTDSFELADQNEHSNIKRHVDWFSHNQSYMDRVTGRASLYLYYILEEVEKRGLPNELALLPAIESAFNPLAYSHSHAAGLWQFVPITGERFKLERNWWVDERRDVLESTQAALDYLTYLHGLFDEDWLLAIAAYNCGEGTVGKAIRKNKAKGLATDFWSLKLPKETRGYVPRLLALSKVIAQPEQFGVTLTDIPNKAHFATVKIPKAINLDMASKMAKLDYETLEALNPAYKRRISSPEGPHRLLLPVKAIDTFSTALASTPESQWAPKKQYVVKAGDSLYKIAKSEGVTVSQLRQTNSLNSDILQIGQRLELPGFASTFSGVARKPYTVKKGDSLWDIAKRNNVSVKSLSQWNNISSGKTIKPGQQLHLSANKSASTSKIKKLRYKVRRGDSLARIANKFYLSVSDIIDWNKINKQAYLQPGQRLTLFVDINNI